MLSIILRFFSALSCYVISISVMRKDFLLRIFAFLTAFLNFSTADFRSDLLRPMFEREGNINPWAVGGPERLPEAPALEVSFIVIPRESDAGCMASL
jgi:hypothetical protein